MGIAIDTNIRLIQVDLSNDTSIAAGGDVTQTLQPAVGKIYEVIWIAMYCPIPAGGTAGTHEVNVYVMNNEASATRAILCKANFGSAIYLGFNGAQLVGDVAENPAGTVDQREILTRTLWCDYDNPILFRYDNDTDVAAALNRVLLILVKEHIERA